MAASALGTLAAEEESAPGSAEAKDSPLIYRGTKQDLPDLLPGFKIPLPRAWFDAIYIGRKKDKKPFYVPEAYAITAGYIVYNNTEAYKERTWRRLLQDPDFFAVQVDWAESPRVDTDRSLAALTVSILRPNTQETALERGEPIHTTQGRFLAFLQSGALADLELTAE